MAIPVHKVRFIQDNNEGAIVYTDIPNNDETRLRHFHTKERTHELVSAFMAMQK